MPPGNGHHSPAPKGLLADLQDDARLPALVFGGANLPLERLAFFAAWRGLAHDDRFRDRRDAIVIEGIDLALAKLRARRARHHEMGNLERFAVDVARDRVDLGLD